MCCKLQMLQINKTYQIKQTKQMKTTKIDKFNFALSLAQLSPSLPYSFSSIHITTGANFALPSTIGSFRFQSDFNECQQNWANKREQEDDLFKECLESIGLKDD